MKVLVTNQENKGSVGRAQGLAISICREYGLKKTDWEENGGKKVERMCAVNSNFAVSRVKKADEI